MHTFSSASILSWGCFHFTVLSSTHIFIFLHIFPSHCFFPFFLSVSIHCFLYMFFFSPIFLHVLTNSLICLYYLPEDMANNSFIFSHYYFVFCFFFRLLLLFFHFKFMWNCKRKEEIEKCEYLWIFVALLHFEHLLLNICGKTTY